MSDVVDCFRMILQGATDDHFAHAVGDVLYNFPSAT